MASSFTNRGKYTMIRHLFDRGVALPTNFNFILTDDSKTPNVDDNDLTGYTEVPNGNGYTTNGLAKAANATNFPSVTEDDTSDFAEITIADLAWTASGGNLPASGNGARWCLMLDDNATPASREIYAFIDLGSNRIVSDTQSLTITGTKLRFT